VLKAEPFGHPIFTDIIRNQWFGKGKADVLAYNKMVAAKEIPDEVIILVVCAVCLSSIFMVTF
jgi:hypothetical protein